MSGPFHRPGALAHQLAAFERFKDASAFALFFDPRTRKTGTTLAIFRHRVERGDVDSLVVLSSPNGVKWVWPEEARAEMPPEFLAAMEMLVWESGKTGESRDSKERIFALRDHPGPVLLSMNAQATLRSEKAWKYLEWFIARRRVMLVADECFTADTLITTPFGDVPICKLTPGDIVTTPSGYSVVKKVLRRRSNEIALHIANQEVVLKSTCNHPLFTDRGWVCANHLAGRILFDRDSIMRLLQQSDTNREKVLLMVVRMEVSPCVSQSYSETEKTTQTLPGMWDKVQSISKEHKEILQSILLSEMALEGGPNLSNEDFDYSSTTRFGRSNSLQEGLYALEQGNTLFGSCSGEVAESSESEWRNFQVPWWEWAYASGASAEFAERLGTALDGGIRHSVGRKATWLSNLLQGRFSISDGESSDRGGRLVSQLDSCEKTRREKGYPLTGTRVDRVEIEQHSRSIPVFDLQLDGDPRYFANGFLAHNSSWAARFSGQTRRLLTLGGWYDRDPSNPGRPTVLVKAILDGTPVDEGPFDIWYPSEFLRKGLLGYSEKAAFEARYSEYEEEPGKRFSMVKKLQGFKDPYDYYPRLKGYRNLDELHDRMMSFGMRVRYEDVTDAPPKQYESLYFEMTDRQQRVYDRLAEEYVAELGARELTVREVLRRMLRLQMVARNYWPPERSGEPCQACDGSGFVLELNEDCPACEGLGSRVIWSSLERIDPDHNPAMEALVERVREARGPFVVWCRFQQDARDVLFSLSDVGIVAPYWGEHSDTANEEVYQAFKCGEVDGIVATIAGGPSHGKDLSRAVLMAYYSNDFKSRLRKQTEERAEGILKRFSTSIVDLIAVGTRDADVVAALRAKRNLAAEIMGDPRPWFRGD